MIRQTHVTNVMKWYTHIATATMVAARLMPDQVALTAVGAILPDVVENLFMAPHRSLHELAVWLTVFALVPMGMGGIAVGSLHHLILDALTIHGITVFGKRVRWVLNTNNIFHNMSIITLHLLLLL
ncbi:MAG: hypothetical protein ACP5IE_00130 [Infirmifilum sp.]